MGAFMNEAYQAQHGLEPWLFPEAVPTYLGHYHLPHTVGASNVRYVGSPYQGATSQCSVRCAGGRKLTDYPVAWHHVACSLLDST